MTPATAEEVYEQAVRPLPTRERLRVAMLILENISPQAVMDLPIDGPEQEDEMEQTGWRGLALQTLARFADDPVDSKAWDRWEPSASAPEKE